MKFIRAELHNHSTESDGALSVETLAAYAAEKNFGVLALTDHNTTSGHAKAYDAIRRAGYALALLPGVEITTFFGHILALGLVQMPDITTLDPRAPEPFFAMLRTAGARAVGIAHPFSVGSPLFIGCRFDMEMHDWNAVDYIEVFNTSVSESGMGAHPMAEAFIGNSRALALWERLVLHAERGGCGTGRGAAPADHRHKRSSVHSTQRKGTRNSNIRQHLRLSGLGTGAGRCPGAGAEGQHRSGTACRNRPAHAALSVPGSGRAQRRAEAVCRRLRAGTPVGRGGAALS